MNKNIFAALITATAAALVFIVVMPEYDAIVNARTGLEQRRTTLADRQAALQNVKTLDGQYRQRQSDIKRVLSFLPETKQNDQIVASIETATIQSGIQLIGMNITPLSQTSSTPSAYKTTYVTINAIGGYTSLLSFLKTLEQHLRLYDIVDMTVSQSTSAGSAPDALDISIKMNAYNLK